MPKGAMDRSIHDSKLVCCCCCSLAPWRSRLERAGKAAIKAATTYVKQALFKKQIPSGCAGGRSCCTALSTDIWPPPEGRPASPAGRTGLTTRPPPWAPAPHHRAPDHHTTALMRHLKPQETNRHVSHFLIVQLI